MLEDIAIISGGEVISEELGRTLESATLADLGQASRIAIIKDNSTIVNGNGDKARITARVTKLKRKLQKPAVIMTKKNSKSV